MPESAGDSPAAAGDSPPSIPASLPAESGGPLARRAPRMGFYIVDSAFRFTFVDSQAAELWEIDPHHLQGRVLWEVFPTAASSDQYPHHVRAMQDRIRQDYTVFSPRYQCWFQMSVEPLGTGGLLCYFSETAASGG